jgi:HAE1 family hydrophobic/amphiphilic exporter-1
MNLSAPFIQKPVMTTLVMFAILLVGIFSYFKLPVSNLPDVAFPVILTQVVYPGANPETMANNIATPLEKEFLTISGLTTVTSSNTIENSNIILVFDINKDINAAAQDVQAAITRASLKLPSDLPAPPIYKKVNPSIAPIIYISLTSETDTLGRLYDYGNTIVAQRLALINGVAEVLVFGSPSAVRVQVEPQKLASFNVTLQDISKTIVDGNPYLPTGLFDGPKISQVINTNGQIYKASGYDDLIVKYLDNSPLRIRDIGKAIDSEQDDRLKIQYVDKELKLDGIVLAVLPQPGANSVRISDEMYKILPEIKKALPSSMNLRIVNDLSESVKESIKDVEFTLLIAFILVVLIIYVYLGSARDTIIPVMVMPMSIIGTLAVMYALNYTIDNLSLMALILAIGFIVDDAIVVIENIVRHVEAGETPWNAAMEGSKQISFTILSMTLSLIAVFIPLIFMGGILGKILAEFANTLTTITLLSGFISLTLTPMLCSIFIKPRSADHDIDHKKHIGERINDNMLDLYKPRLKWMLAHRIFALGGLIFCILLTVILFIALPKDFMPNDDIGFFIAYSQSSQGTSSDKIKVYQDEIVDIFRNNQNISHFVTVSPFQQFRNGLLYAKLKPRSERKPILEVIDELRKKTAEVVGVNVFYKNIPLIDFSLGAQTKGAYQYTIESLKPEILYPAAQKFLEKMNQIPGLQGVNSDLELNSPTVYVDIDRDKAASLGVSALTVERTLQLGYAGGRVSRILTPIDQYDVILELEKSYQKNSSSLDLLYVRSDTNGKLVPLKSVAKWSEGISAESVNHINQFPAVTIAYNTLPETNLGDVLRELDNIAKDVLPEGVNGKPAGAAQAFIDAISGALVLMLITILSIYIILGILYESYIHPITILSTLPPAIVGGLIGLYITGYALSLYSFLGIILLIGIVKKNGIMMVDFAIENVRERSQSPIDSIYDACIVRFRPIMMTTLTAIVGAIPIALGVGAGAEGRRPLGIVIIFGLLFSQFITLFITPVIYLYMENLSQRFRGSKENVLRE